MILGIAVDVEMMVLDDVNQRKRALEEKILS